MTSSAWGLEDYFEGFIYGISEDPANPNATCVGEKSTVK